MKDLKLPKKAAALYAALEAGETLTGGEQASLRDALDKLLKKIRGMLFADPSPEYSEWIARQQSYTGKVVEALAQAHFARLRSRPGIS